MADVSEVLAWVVGVVSVLLIVAWYLSYSAARLDRLHARVEGAMSALDAQLVRRAEAVLELATSGALDPATSLYLVDAASESLEATNVLDLEHDLLEGQRMGEREGLESHLSHAMQTALDREAIAHLRADVRTGAPGLDRVAGAAVRVQLARRFLNDAVTDVQRVRRKTVVRVFRLAGHAQLPQTVEFDDELPPGLRD